MTDHKYWNISFHVQSPFNFPNAIITEPAVLATTLNVSTGNVRLCDVGYRGRYSTTVRHVSMQAVSDGVGLWVPERKHTLQPTSKRLRSVWACDQEARGLEKETKLCTPDFFRFTIFNVGCQAIFPPLRFETQSPSRCAFPTKCILKHCARRDGHSPNSAHSVNISNGYT